MAARRLQVSTTANQDPLLLLVPIIAWDLWEHSFYIQYRTKKAEYLTVSFSTLLSDLRIVWPAIKGTNTESPTLCDDVFTQSQNLWEVTDFLSAEKRLLAVM